MLIMENLENKINRICVRKKDEIRF